MPSFHIPGLEKTFVIPNIVWETFGTPNGFNRIKESTREKAKLRKKKAKLHRKQGRH